MDKITEALALFEKGCLCSQSILTAYGRDHGIERGTAMRLAAAFGGGMRLGETCGAVTGAFMILGLANCSEDCETKPERLRAYAAVEEFARRFRERHGPLACKDLLGCNIATAEGQRQAEDQGLFHSICPGLIRDACEFLEQLTPQTDSRLRLRD